MVYGQTYDFESISVMVPGGPVGSCEEISYDHEKEVVVDTDSQFRPVGYTRGEFKCDVKIVMDRSNFENTINKPALAYGGIYNVPPMPVVVKYGNIGQQPIVDEFEFKIQKVGGLGGKKGTDALKITIEGPATEIPVINGVPAFTPGL